MGGHDITRRLMTLARRFFDNAVSVGKMYDLRHFKTWPELKLEPPMTTVRREEHGAPANAAACERKPFGMGGHVR